MSERASGLSLSVVVQMVIAAGVWLLVLDGWNTVGDPTEFEDAALIESGQEGQSVGRELAFDGHRIEKELDRLVVAVTKIEGLGDRRVPVDAITSTKERTETQVVWPDELVTIVKDLNETLKSIRVRAAPLGGGRVNFESLQVSKMNRELVANLHATVRQDGSAVRDRYVLRSVKSVLSELGKPLRVSSEAGLERWHYSLRDGEEGVSFVVRDGFVTALHLGY